MPLFDGVEEFLAAGLCPGGTRRNLGFAAPMARFAEELSENQRLLLADAQTSGRLLVAVGPGRLTEQPTLRNTPRSYTTLRGMIKWRICWVNLVLPERIELSTSPLPRECLYH